MKVLDGWTVVNGMHLCEECSAEAEDCDDAA